MARIIRFPLKMKNGAEVRSLDELKENFDLESVLGYFTDGKLRTWLADRYYDEKAEAVAALSKDMPDLNAKLCEILEVEYEAESDNTDLEEIQRKNEKYKMLSAVTGDREILDNIDLVAMNQDELYDILDTGSDKVYLYGERFEIPFGKKNISYIGVNEPLVLIDKTRFADDFEEAGIAFKNVRFEEGAYQKKKIYPEPVGEFEIEDGLLIKALPDANGILIIPEGVQEIKDFICSKCNALKSATLPNSVTKIGMYAFSQCTNLKCIKISSNLNSIGKGAFEYCKSLSSIDIPNSVTYIGYGAFNECSNLSDVKLPDSIDKIEDMVLAGCEKLSNIIIPNTVTYIGECAFSGCSFKSIIITFLYCTWMFSAVRTAFRVVVVVFAILLETHLADRVIFFGYLYFKTKF